MRYATALRLRPSERASCWRSSARPRVKADVGVCNEALQGFHHQGFHHRRQCVVDQAAGVGVDFGGAGRVGVCVDFGRGVIDGDGVPVEVCGRHLDFVRHCPAFKGIEPYRTVAT